MRYRQWHPGQLAMIWFGTCFLLYSWDMIFGRVRDWMYLLVMIWVCVLIVMTWQWFGARRPPS